MSNKKLDPKKVRLEATYEFTVPENVTEQEIKNLLENETIPHVLTLIQNGTKNEWKKDRKNINITISKNY